MPVLSHPPLYTWDTAALHPTQVTEGAHVYTSCVCVVAQLKRSGWQDSFDGRDRVVVSAHVLVRFIGG